MRHTSLLLAALLLSTSAASAQQKYEHDGCEYWRATDKDTRAEIMNILGDTLVDRGGDRT